MATAAPCRVPSWKSLRSSGIFWASELDHAIQERERSHGTCQVDVKAAAISHWHVAWCVSSFKCPECVQQSLSDWTHVFHRDESAPFWLVTSASSCPVKMTSDAIARGERLSPLCAHSRLSCDHICGGLCGQACKWVYDTLKVPRFFFFCVSTCMCLSQYVNMDIWPKRHGNLSQIREIGSASRVKVSTAAYWAFLDSWCRSSDVKKNTFLCPQHSQINTRHLFCQVETKGIMMDIRDPI